MVLKMMDECNFRVGNEKYAKENKSFGVCTLENQHVKVGKDSVVVDFIGKEGVRNTCKIKNKRLIKNLRTRKKQLVKKIESLVIVLMPDIIMYQLVMLIGI